MSIFEASFEMNISETDIANALIQQGCSASVAYIDAVYGFINGLPPKDEKDCAIRWSMSANERIAMGLPCRPEEIALSSAYKTLLGVLVV